MIEISQSTFLKLAPSFWQSRFGVEVETQRINSQGQLSRESFPATLGSRSYQPYLQSDFAETQTEWITDPHHRVSDVIKQLALIRDSFNLAMTNDDQIWPLSMPPAVDSADVKFIEQHFDRPKYQQYRDYLTKKYGVAHEIMTGVHVNFSFTDLFWPQLQKDLPTNIDLIQLKNQVTWQLVQNFLRYRWLLTYLFGATPLGEKGYFKPGDLKPTSPVRSLRNSHFGYTNDDSVQISYQQLDQHIQTLQSAVDHGQLYAPMEFYGPVRVKGHAELSQYLTQGIPYLEFRTFDLDPFEANGIAETTLNFFKAFLWGLTLLPTVNEQELQTAGNLNEQVALENPLEPSTVAKPARKFLTNLLTNLKAVAAPTDLIDAVQSQLAKVDHAELTPAVQLIQQSEHNSLMNFGTRQAKHNRQYFLDGEQILPDSQGLTKSQEILLAAVIQIGLHYQWQSDGQVRCWHNQHQALLAPTFTDVAAAKQNLTQIFSELN